jgi:hypothetical protein
MKYLRRNIFSFFTFYFLLFTFYVTPAHAQSAWSGRCVDNGVATIQGLECLFANILQVIVTLAGFAFLVMFVLGGFQYLTSSGDDKKAAAASSTLTMAVVGLVGVTISWLILKFISDFTGANVLEFKIPGP